MISLIDLDSLIYKCKYKIEEDKIINSLTKILTPERIEAEIIDMSIHRLENMYMRIINTVEDTGFNIDSYEFYLTTCKNSFRKRLDPLYKANRQKDPLREKITERFLKETDTAYADDEMEADDLIADRVKELDEEEYIIIACDKDVLALKGYHFNYFRKPSKPNEKSNDMKGLGHNDQDESNKLLALQMLTGDRADNIFGIKGIGEKKAAKILEGKDTEYSLFRSVVVQYYLHNKTKERMRINYRLLKLGGYEKE